MEKFYLVLKFKTTNQLRTKKKNQNILFQDGESHLFS